MKEVKEYQEQLFKIRDELHESTITHDGKSAEDVYMEKIASLNLQEGVAQDGNKVVALLLARCQLWAEIILEKNGKIDERFQDTYDKLVKIRNQLDQMNLTQAWSLRETDLYSFQRQLDRIDESRVDGNFLDAEGKPADLHAQRVGFILCSQLIKSD